MVGIGLGQLSFRLCLEECCGECRYVQASQDGGWHWHHWNLSALYARQGGA
jgi:hypothetical protein